MAQKPHMQCPVCKGLSMIMGVDGKPEPCSRGCRRTLRLRSQKMEIAEQAKKAKAEKAERTAKAKAEKAKRAKEQEANAKTTTEKSSSSGS